MGFFRFLGLFWFLGTLRELSYLGSTAVSEESRSSTKLVWIKCLDLHRRTKPHRHALCARWALVTGGRRRGCEEEEKEEAPHPAAAAVSSLPLRTGLGKCADARATLDTTTGGTPFLQHFRLCSGRGWILEANVFIWYVGFVWRELLRSFSPTDRIGWGGDLES